MSLFSTIAHDGPVPARGLPKGMWIMVAGLVLTATLGFVIANLGESVSVDVSPSSAQGADRVFAQRGAELAAQQAAVRAETERLLAMNEIGIGESATYGADQLFIQRAAELAAEQATLARTERLLEINELGYGPIQTPTNAHVYSEQSNGPR